MAHGQVSIQGLLGGLLKDRRLIGSMRRVMVMTLWDQVVGKMIAAKSWPEKVEDGVLTIGVCSHAWAQELHLLRAEILTRYRLLLGRNVVKDIAFRVARRKALRPDDALGVTALHPSPGERVPAQPVPGDLLDGVANPEVRELLGPVFARLRAQREWKHEHGWVTCSSCHRIYHGVECPQCGPPQNVA